VSLPAAPADPGGRPAEARRAELAGNLEALRERIVLACEAGCRDPAEVTLIAVTKTWPASDVRLLHALGLRDFGENRDTEAAQKAAELAGLDLTWHFVGQLQTNKCRSVARYADYVHSVDRPHLVRALGAAAVSAGRVVTSLIQLSADDDPARGGAASAQIASLAGQVAAEPGLLLGGVMAVAPLDTEPAAAFARLRDAAAVVRAVRPEATIISAGMSGDLEPAIAAGATHVRIGTALLGTRSPRVR
jgi:PLP dependent protein